MKRVAVRIRLLRLLRDEAPLPNTAIPALLSVSRPTAFRALQDLRDWGVILHSDRGVYRVTDWGLINADRL